MNLLLHCGYNKTGSSYIQTVLENAASCLQSNKVLYPSYQRLTAARAGEPTAGNGEDLARALITKDFIRGSKLLADYHRAASQQAMHSVLLSSEAFFAVFSDAVCTDMFWRLQNTLDFSQVRALLFFRDPVEHSLSVYCHRGASGEIPSFADWLEEGYETPDLIKYFLQIQTQYPIDWCLRRYEKSGERLERAVFDEWLGVETPEFVVGALRKVNASISLAEVELTKLFNERFPRRGRHASRRLKLLDGRMKAEDAALRLYCENISVA